MRVRVVAFDADVLELEGKDILHVRVQLQGRQWPRVARQLQLGLVDMVAVEMRITQRMYEIADAVAADLGQHVGEQRI